MAAKKKTSLLCHIDGTYRTHDLVTVSQHVAAQLEALGLAGLEVKMKVRGWDAHGNVLEFKQGGKEIDEVRIDINPDDFERPVLPSSKIEAVPAGENKQKQSRKRGKQPFRKPY